MTTPDFLLTCNLSTGIVTTGGSDTWAPPVITWGESKTFALRFTEQQGAQTIEPTLDIQATKASFGPLDERPESGRWKLQIGSGAQTVGNTSNEVEYDCSPAELAAAINARTAVTALYGTAAVTQQDGSWIIQFGTGSEYVPMIVRDNTLQPISLGQINAYTVDETWLHEVRLMQAALAFTDTAERVLPPPPMTTIVRTGGSGAGYSINQQQQLYVPPSFRGSFYLQDPDGNQTVGLSLDDNPETIQAALETILGKGNVVASLPEAFTVQIELTGDLAGTNPTKLLVVTFDPPVGDLTFTIDFTKGQLLRRLRKEKAVTLPLEVRIYVGDAREETVAIRVNVTVRAPLIFPELSTVPEIDWLLPPSPKNYVPFNRETVITGQQFNQAVVGNGTATVFVFDHGLDTGTVFVWVRENTAPGAQLVEGDDFSVEITDDNSVTVTALGTAPTTGQWVITVMSAQTVAAFADGLTVTTGQVTGLDTLLAALSSSIAALAAMAPTTPLGTTAAGVTGSLVTIEIPNFEDAFPAVKIVDGKPALVPLPRAGGLIPAIHDASVTSITSGGLPSISTGAGNVYQNNTSAALLVPGGLGTRGSTLAIGGYAGSDGRRFYPLSRQGATSSYFPRDYERQLFMFEVSSQMLRAGTTLTLDFLLALQLLAATSRMQAVLVVEHGAISGDTTPGTPATNLAAITWSATPMLSQRVIVGDNKVTHSAGISVIRSAGGTLSANKRIYGFETAADAVPAAADFAIRGRLINWDTENSVSNARGIISLALSTAQAAIA